MSDLELKQRFAAEWLASPNDPFKAACNVYGADTGKALYAATHWINDPDVLAEKQRLIDEDGEDAFLPNKAELCRKVWDMAQGEIEARDKLAALRLYGELRNYIEKPNSAVTVNTNVTTNKVMVVREKATVDEWERGLIEQQRRLVNVNESARH